MDNSGGGGTAIFTGTSDQLNSTGKKPAIWPITDCDHRSVTQRCHMCLDLHECRIGQRAPVREPYCGYRLVTAVDALHEGRSRFVPLDVDGPVPDPLPVQLAAQPVAVAAPGGRVHGEHRHPFETVVPLE